MYDNLSDKQLSDALYEKYYSNMDRSDFNQQIGYEEPGFFDAVGDLARGAGYGFTSMVPLAAEGIGALSYATGLPILPGMDPEESLDESAIVQWGRQSQKDLREYFGGDSRSMAYGLGNALGSFASFFVPGLGQAGIAARATGMAGRVAAKAVGTGGQAALAVGAGAGDQAERILNLYEQEGNKYPAAEENLKQAILQGGAIGLSELAPVKMVGKILARGIPKSVPAETRNKILADAANILFKTAPRRMASVGVGEGTQELIAGYLQDLTEKGLYNPNLEVGESAMADFGYGASAGAIFQGGIELITPGLRRRRQERLDAERESELQAAAEEEEKIREVSPAGQIEDAPLTLPTPQPVLMLEDMREDSDTFINATEDVSPLIEQTISEFADDLPLSFNRGAIVAADEVGTPDSYSVNTNNKGSFVESKQGVKVSPYFATTEQASEFRDGLNLGVNDLLETQDRAETNRLAAEAIKDAGYGPDSANVSTGSLLEAARRTQVTESIPVSDLPGDTVTQINARRLQTGQRAFSPDDLLTPGDLAEAGVSEDVISQVSPSSSLQVTPDDILSLAEQKNIMVEDAGFERFAQRLIGNARIDSPSVSPGQLGYLYETIEQMPALPGDGPQRLPVIRKPEFSGSQYSAVVSLAKRNGSEGILKSDINKTLDLKRGAPTESIINSAVERGDLIEHPTKKNRWMSRSVYDAEARSLDSPLRRGEQIEGEARRQEEAERQTQEARARAVFGPGIQIPRERQEGDTRSIPEASRDFKERISGSILTPEAESKMADINRSIQQELQRFQKILPKGMAIGRDIQVKLVDSLGEGREGAATDPVDGKVVISLALDLANLNAKTTDQVKNNLKNVLNHEVIHALRSLGVLTDGDFAILEKYAKNNKRKGDTLTFYEDIKERYTEEALGYPPTEELLVEESIADAFRYWADGNVKLTGKPRSLFNRIVDFFKSLSNGFTNADITSAEQMFEGLRSPLGTTQRDRDVGLQAPDAPPDAAGVQAPDAPMDAPIAREPVTQPQAPQQAPQQAPRQAPQPDVVSEPDLADPVVVAEREEPVARPEPETVLDAEDEVALNKVLQAHDAYGYYKSLKGQAFNEQQVNAAKNLYIDLVDANSATIMRQAIDTERLGRKYGVLVGDGFTGADSYATLENLEALSADSRDAVKYSLYPAQLDGVARRILGADTVQDGNLTRRVRASDVPRELLSRYMERRLSRDEERALDRQQAAIQGKYSLARKPVDPKDPVFTARNEENDRIQVAGKTLPKAGKARKLSSVDILYNPEFKGRKGVTAGYVAKLIQARARRVLGEPVFLENDTSKDGIISDALAMEAIAALNESGNASNWYSTKVEQAVDTAAELYPEIKTDPEAKFAFLTSLAITSQNTPVMENSRYTVEVYERFKQDGRFPEDYEKGKHGKAMSDNFKLLNRLVDEMGSLQAVAEFFEAEFTVGDLKKKGYKPPSGENVDTDVYGSFLLGPKIGQGFYQNLIGNFSPVTIDMWLMRTVGRVTGRLIGKPELIEAQTDRLIEGLRADPEKRGSNFLIASLFDAKIDGDVDAVVEIADQLRLEHDRLFQTPEVQALYRAKQYDKPLWAKASENIITQQFKPQDSPYGGNFRNAVRRVMDKTRKKLEKSGYSVTNADLQAILWYPEKDLFSKLGVRAKQNLNIDYADAFDIILKERTGDETASVQAVGRREDGSLIDDGRGEGEVGEGLGRVDETQVKYSLSRPNETLLNFIKSNPEGFTVTVDGEAAPEGYVVAPIKDAEMVIKASELNENTVNEYAKMLYDVAQATGQKVYAGGWLNRDDNLYYLDAVNIYNDLDTALYIANSADQIAIFDLRTFNEIRTPEGIEQLKQSGAYSDNARDDARRSSDEAAQRFKEIRSQGEQRFSLARNVENQRRNLERYTKKIGAPVSAFVGRPLAARDETGYYPRIIITDPDGRNQAADVFVPGGYDRRIEDPAKPERSVGFGEKHYKKHQKKVPVHTYGSYNSIEDLARAALKAYWPFRNNPEAGGFKVKEQSGPTGNTRYRIEWQSEDFGYPAVFVFEPIYYDVLSPSFVRKNPEFSGRQTAQLVTAFIGPSDKVKNNPIAQPAISIDPDRTTEVQKAVDRGVNDAINPPEARKVKREVLSLRNKFSLRRQDNGMTPDQKKLAKEKFNEEKNETFFEKIMGSMNMNDPRDRPTWVKWRFYFQDRYSSPRYIAGKADEIQKMAVESHAWTAFSQLERSKGVSAAAITKGPLIRSGGLITALNEKLINNSSDPAAKRQYEEAFERLRRETRIDDYVDPTTGERVVLEYKDPKDLKGLAEIFAELDQNQMLGTFQLYAAGRRAQRLKQEGRENLFTDAEIETAIQAGVNNPAVERAYRQYQLWNKSLVNMMRDTGVISAEAAELWTQNADYLPFYRQAYDDAGTLYDVVDGGIDKAGDLDQVSNDPNNNIFENMYGIPAPKELKGGKPAFMILVNNSATEKAYTTYESAKARADILRKMNKNARVRVVKTSQRIESPLDNILRNLDAAVHASLSNVAASRAVRDLHKLGMAERLGKSRPVSPNVNAVGIRINGDTVYYEVQDDFLLNAMKSSGEFSMPFLDLLSSPARLLRTLITKEPGFMLANLMRDSMSSWMTSGITRVPGPSTAVGLVKAVVGNAEAEALEAVGFVGGYDAKRDARAEAIFRQQRRSPLNPAKWWDTLDRLTMASDTATRVAVYNRVLKTTQNPTAAMFEALEVINFSRRGAGTFFNLLTATIPFLNARIQGLDVMFRGARGKVGTESTITQPERQRRFIYRFLTFAAINAMYAFWLMSEDEEENPWYYNANETDKDMYWIISPRWFGVDSDDASGFKIPIPFELGILGKVIPERIIRSLADNTDQPDNFKSVLRHLTGTLAVQFPQAMMPLFEVMTNHDFYSGRPIVPYWAGRTEAITADATTASPVAISASNQLSDMNIDFDPRNIDHLIRGYLGTVGSYALLATDGIMRNYLDLPSPADKRPDQYPVLSRFLQERAGTGPTEAFYTLANEVDVFTKTLADLDQQGRADDWYKRAKKNEGLLDVADDVKAISKELSELRKLRREIDNDRVMSAQDKKKSFIQIQEMMNEIASEYGKRKAEFMKRTD